MGEVELGTTTTSTSLGLRFALVRLVEVVQNCVAKSRATHLALGLREATATDP